MRKEFKLHFYRDSESRMVDVVEGWEYYWWEMEVGCGLREFVKLQWISRELRRMLRAK